MCGRFSLSTAEKDLLLSRFHLKEISVDLKPRYNIAPSQNIPVILNESPSILSEAKWGLIPSWAKDEKIGFKMINARAESIDEKPAYKGAFKHNRCLVVADSYFEWRKSTKTPFRIMMKDEDLFAFAGIFSRWKEITTCSIVTTEPNELMKKIHIRMPVILEKNKEKEWLNSEPERAKELLKPYNSEKMKAYEISSLVNSPMNDSPEIVKPAKTSNLKEFLN